MTPIGKSCWLYQPWKLMSHNECYRHYQYIDGKYGVEQNLLIVRTSEKCYKVTNWRTVYGVRMSKIEMSSFRSFFEVRQYARSIV